MLGPDVEALVSGIDSIISTTIGCINTLAKATAPRIYSDAEHAGVGSGHCVPEERIAAVATQISSVAAVVSAMAGASANASSIGSSLFVSANSYNNSVGSPWNELNRLTEVAGMLNSAPSTANYMGEKVETLALMNMVLSAAVDAKWAVIYYHDILQRGYDSMFNNNSPSITYNDSVTGERSFGNVKQDYSDNVNLPPESIDPY